MGCSFGITCRVIKKDTFLKKDCDPCFLLGQSSHCGLACPLGKAPEAGLAGVSFLGKGQDPRAPECQKTHKNKHSTAHLK